MNKAEAKKVAEKAIQAIDGGSDYEYVNKYTSIVAGRDNSGYWVADNGDERSGMNRTQAIEVIVDCLIE